MVIRKYHRTIVFGASKENSLRACMHVRKEFVKFLVDRSRKKVIKVLRYSTPVTPIEY